MSKKHENKTPTVSVIIPTYNRTHLVGRAIQSVLNQTYKDFEIIVVDDGSTDNTEEVVKNFKDPRIHYIRHKENKGGSAARNTGIKTSKGEYIAFLDSDDEWLPNKLQKQLEIFKRCNSRVGAIYTGYVTLNQKNEVVRRKMPECRGYIFKNLLFSGCVGTISTPIIKRKCFKRVGGFDGTLPSYQDWDMWIRIAKIYEFDYIQEPLVKYYKHQEGIFSNPKNRMIGRSKLLTKIVTEMELNREKFKFSRREISARNFQLGKIYCRLGEMRRARHGFLKLLKYILLIVCIISGSCYLS